MFFLLVPTVPVGTLCAAPCARAVRDAERARHVPTLPRGHENHLELTNRDGRGGTNSGVSVVSIERGKAVLVTDFLIPWRRIQAKLGGDVAGAHRLLVERGSSHDQDQSKRRNPCLS